MKKIAQFDEEQFESMIRDQKKFKAYLKVDPNEKLNMDFWGTPELLQNLDDFAIYLEEGSTGFLIVVAKNPIGHKYAFKVPCGEGFMKE